VIFLNGINFPLNVCICSRILHTSAQLCDVKLKLVLLCLWRTAINNETRRGSVIIRHKTNDSSPYNKWLDLYNNGPTRNSCNIVLTRVESVLQYCPKAFTANPLARMFVNLLYTYNLPVFTILLFPLCLMVKGRMNNILSCEGVIIRGILGWRLDLLTTLHVVTTKNSNNIPNFHTLQFTTAHELVFSVCYNFH
jgi:hypothetical protein